MLRCFNRFSVSDKRINTNLCSEQTERETLLRPLSCCGLTCVCFPVSTCSEVRGRLEAAASVQRRGGAMRRRLRISHLWHRWKMSGLHHLGLLSRILLERSVHDTKWSLIRERLRLKNNLYFTRAAKYNRPAIKS